MFLSPEPNLVQLFQFQPEPNLVQVFRVTLCVSGTSTMKQEQPLLCFTRRLFASSNKAYMWHSGRPGDGATWK